MFGVYFIVCHYKERQRRSNLKKRDCFSPALLGLAMTAIFLSVVLNNFCFAQEKSAGPQTQSPQVKRKVITREVVGEVAGISGNFIAVDYKTDSKIVYELALVVDKNTRVLRKALKDMVVGDLIAVTYEETIETIEGQKPKTLKRLAKVIEFRQGSKLNQPESGILKSGE